MNKKLIKSTLFIFFALVVFSACGNPRNTIKGDDLPTKGVATQVANNRSTEVTQPTATSIMPIKGNPTLPSFFQKDLLPGDSTVSAQCLSSGSIDEVVEPSSSQVLILERKPGGNINSLQAINNVSKQLTNLNGQTILNASVSPDNKSFAFLAKGKDNPGQDINRTLVIANSEQSIYEYEISSLWFAPHWVNNEEILFALGEEIQGIIEVPQPATLIRFNIYNSQTNVLEPNFPKVIHLSNIDWNDNGVTAYSPDFSHVVYASSNSGESNYILWDLLLQEPVVEIPTNGYLPADPPVWYVNGDSLLLVLFTTGNPELYLISKGGAISQLTNFGNVFAPGYRIHDYTWAPNGKSVAFYVSPYDSTKEMPLRPELAILDLSSGHVTFLCSSPYSSEDTHQLVREAPPSLFWSPDSSMILTSRVIDQDSSTLIIINVKKGVKIEIENNNYPLGWITESDDTAGQSK